MSNPTRIITPASARIITPASGAIVTPGTNGTNGSAPARREMNLFHAHHQWSTRPADERFTSLDAMYAATRGYAESAVGAEVAWRDLQLVEGEGNELHVVGPSGTPARIGHYAFGQLAQRAGGPASYLRTLPNDLAAAAINYGLARRHENRTASLLFHSNGSLLLRAATSDIYQRVWNYEIVERLQAVSARHGLVPARPTFTWDGSDLRPEAEQEAALYASDHDLFAFLMTPDRAIVDPMGAGLFRGVIVRNSEVGEGSLKIMGFYFRDVCGNFIIWGVRQIAEISLVHVGKIHQRWNDATVRIRQYFDGAASLDQADFADVTRQIAGTKDEVLDTLFGLRSLNLSRKLLEASYDAVVPEQDGDARTRWGFAQGMTRHSQQTAFADERFALDRAAGKLLAIKF